MVSKASFSPLKGTIISTLPNLFYVPSFQGCKKICGLVEKEKKLLFFTIDILLFIIIVLDSIINK